MRPLIVALPMLRAPRPEMVSESIFTGAVLAAGAGGASDAADAAMGGGAGIGSSAGACVPGLAKRAFATGTLASIFSYVTDERNGLPFTPCSREWGRYQPFTDL